MAEHRIRLRGGWDCRFRPGDDPEAAEVVRRVDLPTAWDDEFPRLLRLARHFGRPPFEPGSEWVELELRAVPGLRSARLNGREVRPEVADEAGWSIRLGDALLPRNGLILEVDRGPAGSAPGPAWGEVALVIRPR